MYSEANSPGNTEPGECRIYYSTSQSLLTGSLMVCTFLLALALVDNKWDSLPFGALMGGVFLIKNFRILFGKRPQLIINRQGIAFPDQQLHTWYSIRNEKITHEVNYWARGSSPYYLEYDHISGHQRIYLDDYDITPEGLQHVIQTFRDYSVYQKAKQ